MSSSLVTVKQEFPTGFVPPRCITPQKNRVLKCDTRKYKHHLKDVEKTKALPDLEMKKYILDIVEDHPKLWTTRRPRPDVEWEKVGVELFRRTGTAVGLKSLRETLRHSKQNLRKKMQWSIMKKRLDATETERVLWSIPYYGHFRYFREFIRTEEEALRTKLRNQLYPDATEDELQIIEYTEQDDPEEEGEAVGEEIEHEEEVYAYEDFDEGEEIQMDQFEDAGYEEVDPYYQMNGYQENYPQGQYENYEDGPYGDYPQDQFDPTPSHHAGQWNENTYGPGIVMTNDAKMFQNSIQQACKDHPNRFNFILAGLTDIMDACENTEQTTESNLFADLEHQDYCRLEEKVNQRRRSHQ